MRLYVETNFVLELALDQPERTDCEDILDLAEAGRVELAIPAYAMAEPYETLGRRHKSRRLFQQHSSEQLAELARSQARTNEALRLSETLADVLAKSAEDERSRLQAVSARITGCATVVPLDSHVLDRAVEIQEEMDLGPQDSLILASIQRHLDDVPSESCLVTTNKDDFAIPDVEDLLVRANCALMWRFSAALGYVRSRMQET